VQQDAIDVFPLHRRAKPARGESLAQLLTGYLAVIPHRVTLA
jgi:hypothetical protein